MSKFKFNVGNVVKANPFRIQQAWEEFNSETFDGEREILRLSNARGDVFLIRGSNNWRAEDLLLKGVDYT